MVTDPDGSKWLRPLKLREYHVDHAAGVDTVEEAEKRLWLAVMGCTVRVRHNGVIYGPEWLKQLVKITFMAGEPFALPPYIELSVEDARRLFGT
jgi:hypothetical protein